jgi:predicted MFS family arabinose efflux permease
VSGIGVGNAIGGALLERFGPSMVFGASAASVLLAAALSTLLRASPASTTA